MTTGSERSIPLCCRKNGKHHCMMMHVQQSETASSPSVSAPHEKCPCCPNGILPASSRADLYTLPASGIFFAAIQSHPAVFAQTQARYRMASERSRLKRGPPATL